MSCKLNVSFIISRMMRITTGTEITETPITTAAKFVMTTMKENDDDADIVARDGVSGKKEDRNDYMSEIWRSEIRSGSREMADGVNTRIDIFPVFLDDTSFTFKVWRKRRIYWEPL